MYNWITLPQNTAVNHPAHGIKGAASFLRAISVVLPCLGLFLSIGMFPEIISTRGSLLPIDYVLVLPYVIYFLWSGQNAMLLSKHNASFIRSFFTFLATGPIISIVVQLIWFINTGSQTKTEALSVNLLSILLAWGTWAAIWGPYVLFSKRINVTLLRRVRSNDAFLQTVGVRGEIELAEVLCAGSNARSKKEVGARDSYPIEKFTKLLIAGVVCGVAVASLGLANTYRLKWELDKLSAVCREEGARKRNTPDVASFIPPSDAIMLCDAETLAQMPFNVGIQGELVSTYSALESSRRWPFMLAIAIACILAVPWLRCFLLNRIRELRE